MRGFVVWDARVEGFEILRIRHFEVQPFADSSFGVQGLRAQVYGLGDVDVGPEMAWHSELVRMQLNGARVTISGTSKRHLAGIPEGPVYTHQSNSKTLPQVSLLAYVSLLC